MAKIQKSELKALSAEETKKKIAELKEELMKLRTQSKTGTQMESPGRIQSLKRMIARLHTYQTMKQKGGKNLNA